MFTITSARNAGWYQEKYNRAPRLYPSKESDFEYALWVPTAELFLTCEEDGTVEWIDANGKPSIRFEVKEKEAHIKIKQAHNNICVKEAIVNGQPKRIRFRNYPGDICIKVRWSGRSRSELKRQQSAEKWTVTPTKNSSGQ